MVGGESSILFRASLDRGILQGLDDCAAPHEILGIALL